MSEIRPSSLEQDLRKTQERNFFETISTFIPYSESVIMESGESAEGDPYTRMLIILKDSSQTSESLRELKINLGLDSSILAIITTEGNGVIIDAPISDGRMEQIFNDQPSVDPMLKDALNDVREKSLAHAKQVNLDSMSELEAQIKASLGETYTGPNR